MASPMRELERLLPLMVRDRLDVIALVGGANFQRLFHWDFHQNERPVVVLLRADGKAVAVVPHLELPSFNPLGFTGEVFFWRDEEGFEGAFQQAGAALGKVARLGVEGQRMRVFEQMALARAFPGTEIVDAHAAISTIRLHKTAEELAELRRAIRLSEVALEATIRRVRLGMTEREVEGLLVGELFAAGAEELAFAPIVAAGDNSAQSHAKARADYRIKAGDALLFDFGGAVSGYRADITRTFFLGHVSDQDRAFYDAVLAANAVGRASARPGITAHDLDDAVLTSLEASPFARFMRHKTGHGLGLEVHEDPYIMRTNGTVLAKGMVFTIEPGLYEEGRIGVRIEDDVVLTKTGVEVLTSFPRELRVIGES
jgi:Xaa-Pro dipeptidase